MTFVRLTGISVYKESEKQKYDVRSISVFICITVALHLNQFCKNTVVLSNTSRTLSVNVK